MAKKNRFRLWVLITGGLLVLFLPGLLQLQQLKERRRELQTEIHRLKQENSQLQQQSRLLQQDPFYIEWVARRKLGVAREGEVIYRFGKEETSSP